MATAITTQQESERRVSAPKQIVLSSLTLQFWTVSLTFLEGPVVKQTPQTKSKPITVESLHQASSRVWRSELLDAPSTYRYLMYWRHIYWTRFYASSWSIYMKIQCLKVTNPRLLVTVSGNYSAWTKTQINTHARLSHADFYRAITTAYLLAGICFKCAVISSCVQQIPNVQIKCTYISTRTDIERISLP